MVRGTDVTGEYVTQVGGVSHETVAKQATLKQASLKSASRQ
jgi:hypothetical protein